MHDSIDDVEELLPDAVLCLDSTAFKPCQIVSDLNTVAAERSLEPLEEVKESFRFETEVHGIVQ